VSNMHVSFVRELYSKVTSKLRTHVCAHDASDARVEQTTADKIRIGNPFDGLLEVRQ
jgi:hypothetical protein